jgi:LCP family protein required for cell wall assembly
MFVIAALVGGFVAWRVYDSFSTINQVSTPPPVLSGESLGGDAKVEIDTAPAQAAVATYEAAKRDDDRLAAANPTEPANDIAAIVDPTETVEPAATDAINAAGDDVSATEPPTEQSESTDPIDSAVQTTPTATVIPTEGLTFAEPTTAPLPEFGEDTLDILLMGVDAQEGESIDVGVRPDALAVLHLDRATGSCRMLAIPRDTRVELPGYGQSKVNHALAVGGVPYQLQVVEQYLDIELDHYGLIDFSGVVKIVDEVGGVEVDNPVAFTSIGIYFPAGKQTLDGESALAYARFRSDDQGDFGRIGRQQEVLRAVMKKVSPGDLVGMIPQMLPLLTDHFRTDLSPLDMADFARTYGSSCTYESLDTSTLQGTTGTFYDPLIQLDLSYVIIDEDELARKKEWLFGE